MRQPQQRLCVVCHERRAEKEMHIFVVDETRRAEWVKRVRSTQEGRDSLMAQLNETNRPFLCGSHFSASNYDHHPNYVILRPDAIPFYNVSEQ